MRSIQTILSIAGFDTSCGAGICADVKTAESLSFHACTAITAITYQNTCGISGFEPTNKESLQKQLKAVLDDITVDAVKVGMLPNGDAAEAVARAVKELKVAIVLDPVINSTTGYSIGSVEAYRQVMRECTVVTPNAYEAEQLTGRSVKDVKSAKIAAEEVSDGFSVAITGVNGKDIVFDASSQRMHVIGKELKVGEVHGTGCVYSTSLACLLASGVDLYNACKKARRHTISAARRALTIGDCLPVVNP